MIVCCAYDAMRYCIVCLKPDRPLVTGEVVPRHALGIGLGFLLGAVASAWAVHPVGLQVRDVRGEGNALSVSRLLGGSAKRAYCCFILYTAYRLDSS